MRTYLLERRREMGFPEEVTSWDWIVIGEKRATRPYHWAANLSKPTAFDIGSWKVAVGFQRERWRREGRPSKSWGVLMGGRGELMRAYIQDRTDEDFLMGG